MCLLGLPLVVRLQIWHRYLALQGKANCIHGHGCHQLRAPYPGSTLSSSPRRRNVSTETAAISNTGPPEHDPESRSLYALGRSLDDAMRLKAAPGASAKHVPSDVRPDGGLPNDPGAMKSTAHEKSLEQAKNVQPVGSGTSGGRRARVRKHATNPIRKHETNPTAKHKTNLIKRLEIDPMRNQVENVNQASHANTAKSAVSTEDVVAQATSAPTRLPDGTNPHKTPLNLQYLQEDLEVPTKAQYPQAPDRLFQTHQLIRILLGKACKNQLNVKFEGAGRLVYKTDDGKFAFEESAKIPSLATVKAAGEGSSVKNARRAAVTQLLAKLHANGILRKLYPLLPSEKSTAAKTTSTAGNLPLTGQEKCPCDKDAIHSGPLSPEFQLADNAERTFQEVVFPLKKEYLHASPSLFTLSGINQAINDAFTGAKLSRQVDGRTQDESTAGSSIVSYRLNVEVSGVNKSTTGQGRNKNVAKAMAWARMLRVFHESGILCRLLPAPNQSKDQVSIEQTQVEEQAADEQTVDEEAVDEEAVDEEAVDEEAVDEQDFDLDELVTVDKKTMEAERDAKVEIYNWAACLGLVPQFEARLVKRRKPGTRRQANAKHIEAVEASIKLPELGIQVLRVGSTLRIAETAAAVAFKEAAETRQIDRTLRGHSKDISGWSLLNTDTADQFFDFYRSVNEQVYLELESESRHIARETHNHAQITINDKNVGRPVTMTKKTDAEQLARLTAAIELVNAEPALLERFAAVVRDGKAKLIRDMEPIKVSMSSRNLDTMRNGLVEARQAGLSDVRQSLLPESAVSDENTIHSRRRPLTHARQILSKSLVRALRKFEDDPGTAQIRETRASLPMSQYQDQVLQLVAKSPFCIIIGATGSGKTIQVPQIILDQEIRRGDGGFCDVICTQPRRLAAISVASRVAAERNDKVGNKVGYHVRFDCKAPKLGGSISYCTTGILLEQLKYDSEGIFDTVSHIVIDEVHERSLQIDFLMVLLKRTIKDRLAAGKPVPKVILMSATLDPHLFAEYFAEHDGVHKTPAPILSVPGRTFPVQKKYVQELVGQFSAAEQKQLDAMAQIDKGTTTSYLASELAFAKSAPEAKAPAIDWKREATEADKSAAQEKEEALVPISLAAVTIAHICKNNADGAVLVFLPGLPEIMAVRDALVQNPALGMNFDDEQKFKICQLHSALPPHEQKDVLELVPKGCRKIILSTTIAETSVTVPDVKYVVDSGKLRQKRYDQARRITQLVTTWESSSNAKQRAGRAGRVQAGNYYALYTRKRREAMAASAPPELHLSDLQETCLSVKAQGFNDSVQSFLDQTIEPPSREAVAGAIADLKEVEALTDDESLTALGRTLSRLPVHPSLGKMILLGIIFRCLDPVIVLSSLDRDRSLFVSPTGKRAEAKKVLNKYHLASSDQLAFYEAFKELRKIRAELGIDAADRHAWPNFLHFGSFKSIAATAESIENILTECGLVPKSTTPPRYRPQYGGKALNRHSDNAALIKALFLAGVQPNLAAKNSSKSLAHRTRSEKKILIHPSSLNHVKPKDMPSNEDMMYAYESLRKTLDGKTMFMKDTTRVTPLQVLLFGGDVRSNGSHTLTMDDWLPFKIESLEDSKFATRLVLEFRKALDRMLNGAFNSLSEKQEGITMADDPIRDGFVTATVSVLSQADELTEMRKRDSGTWVPEGWRRVAATAVEGDAEEN